MRTNNMIYQYNDKSLVASYLTANNCPTSFEDLVYLNFHDWMLIRKSHFDNAVNWKRNILMGSN